MNGGELIEEKVVGVQGFEPWTPWSQTRCATRLRHTPTKTNIVPHGPYIGKLWG